MTHPPIWPWAMAHPLARDFSSALRLIERQTQGLPLLDWQASIRLGPSCLRPNRLLLGFSPQGVEDRQVLGLPSALHMPVAAARDFDTYSLASRTILLAAEMGEDEVAIKAYLEFDPSRTAPVSGLLMRAFRWQWRAGQSLLSQSAPPARVSDYFALDRSTEQVLAMLRLRVGVPEGVHAAYAVAEYAIVRAMARHPDGLGPEVWVVTEQDSQRASCCVRLSDSGLSLLDLLPAMGPLISAWSLQERLSPDILGAMGPRPLTWLAAGMDARGEPFVTLHGSASRSDAWQAMALGEMYSSH